MELSEKIQKLRKERGLTQEQFAERLFVSRTAVSIGVHMLLYTITDWAGVAAIFTALGFAVLGLVQWIKRKNFLKVDSSILVLGVFYLIVFGAYIFFEFCVINRRPILINGVLEASYPSSTTMLAMCVMPTAILQFRRLIGNIALRRMVNGLCALFTAFMVIGRLVCGVHWFTDILGGLLFSVAMILLYCSADNYFGERAAETPAARSE